MREIREWLEKGGSYAAGVALYETHGSSQVVLKTLRHGETDFTRATLRRELARLLVPGPPQKVASSSQNVVSSPENVVSSPEKVASSPLDEQRRTWQATRAHLHAQLALAATDQERRQLCADVLALSEKITASFDPAPEPVEASLPADAGEARRQLANLRSQASKLKNCPDRAGDLARARQQIRELEQVLKNPRDGEPQLHPRH